MNYEAASYARQFYEQRGHRLGRIKRYGKLAYAICRDCKKVAVFMAETGQGCGGNAFGECTWKSEITRYLKDRNMTLD